MPKGYRFCQVVKISELGCQVARLQRVFNCTRLPGGEDYCELILRCQVAKTTAIFLGSVVEEGKGVGGTPGECPVQSTDHAGEPFKMLLVCCSAPAGQQQSLIKRTALTHRFHTGAPSHSEPCIPRESARKVHHSHAGAPVHSASRERHFAPLSTPLGPGPIPEPKGS